MTRCTFIDDNGNPCSVKNAVFGLIGTKKGLFCKKHKPHDYVDVKNKKCKKCHKQPTFAYVGQKATHCTNHKLVNMVDVNHETCEHPDCTIIPTYAFIGQQARFCSKHKQLGMVDVKHTTCEHPDCIKQPTFAIIGQTARFCSKHKGLNMVNVIDKTCEQPDCTIIPNYAFIGQKARFCSKHKELGMVDVKNTQCKDDDCTKQPSYGYPSYSSEYCAKHKLDRMVSNPTKYKDGFIECVICCHKVHYTQEYCDGCKYYLVNGHTKHYKRKEEAIKYFLEENKIEFIHDNQVADGCSKKRPDFLIHTSWGVIILEVDEHQHNRKTYTCECEITRMKQIYFDNGVQNLLFIRYNPDGFISMDIKKRWSQSERQDYLLKYIESLENVEGLGVIYLFYDGFTRDIEIDKIDPYA